MASASQAATCFASTNSSAWASASPTLAIDRKDCSWRSIDATPVATLRAYPFVWSAGCARSRCQAFHSLAQTSCSASCSASPSTPRLRRVARTSGDSASTTRRNESDSVDAPTRTLALLARHQNAPSHRTPLPRPAQLSRQTQRDAAAGFFGKLERDEGGTVTQWHPLEAHCSDVSVRAETGATCLSDRPPRGGSLDSWARVDVGVFDVVDGDGDLEGDEATFGALQIDPSKQSLHVHVAVAAKVHACVNDAGPAHMHGPRPRAVA
jgi:hypothetical protein